MSKAYLGKTGIEYGDRGWNFYPGCLHKPQGVCPVPHCWAEGMAKRQQQEFHQPHLVPELLLAPLRVKKPSVILVNFMGDLMGDWVDPDMKIQQELPSGVASVRISLKGSVFTTMKVCPQHRFLFLTKSPENYAKWGAWPENAWLGASVWNQDSFIDAIYHPNGGLRYLKAKHKWLSIEPLLGEIKAQTQHLKGFSWIVIGGQANPKKLPDWDWVSEIIMTADKAGIPVFLKNNLSLPKISVDGGIPFYKRIGGGTLNTMELRQEVPV